MPEWLQMSVLVIGMLGIVIGWYKTYQQLAKSSLEIENLKLQNERLPKEIHQLDLTIHKLLHPPETIEQRRLIFQEFQDIIRDVQRDASASASQVSRLHVLRQKARFEFPGADAIFELFELAIDDAAVICSYGKFDELEEHFRKELGTALRRLTIETLGKLEDTFAEYLESVPCPNEEII
ncbi:MAG: hypothetical protein KDB27_33265 [Planctomycetales bacterium]|nr:hypothetical protein [Planctomycetales bacterium]